LAERRRRSSRPQSGGIKTLDQYTGLYFGILAESGMRVLLTGGTGVIGTGVIPELLAAGYQVRLLSRAASEHVSEWPAGVEAVDGDVTNATSIKNAADGCEAVLHVTGIVDEKPPEITFTSVNVEGTRNMLCEAERAGTRRFIYVSSLGAERGQSPYHQSKREAEALVREFSREFVIVRPGHVFGPGDEMISMALKMVRVSPLVPEVGLGQYRFQPLWFADAGLALAKCVSHPDVAGQTIEIAGAEVLTVHELISTLAKITDRPGLVVPVPAVLVRVACWLTERLQGLIGSRQTPALPLNTSKLTMLVEENIVADGTPNALTGMLSIQPTPLVEALKQLADLVPENPPETGVGRLERKRFWADLSGSDLDSAGLMNLFKTRITEVMPIDFCAEPGAAFQIEPGCTLSAHLPARGHVQVRVEQCDADRVTFVTIEGHPLAGIVTFSAQQQGPGLRFSVETFARAANALDWLAIKSAGHWFQDLTWKSVVEKMVKISGGTAREGVLHEAEALDDEAAAAAERWSEDLIANRKRGEREADLDERAVGAGVLNETAATTTRQQRE